MYPHDANLNFKNQQQIKSIRYSYFDLTKKFADTL